MESQLSEKIVSSFSRTSPDGHMIEFSVTEAGKDNGMLTHISEAHLENL